MLLQQQQQQQQQQCIRTPVRKVKDGHSRDIKTSNVSSRNEKKYVKTKKQNVKHRRNIFADSNQAPVVHLI